MLQTGRYMAKKGRKMDLLTIDFETYYDKKFSLSKLTTEEYIRDSRFEVIGVSVKKNDEPSVWFSGTHTATKKFLAKYDWENSAVLAHNAMFDIAILSWRYMLCPARILDTLSMARAIHTIEVGGSLKALSEYYELGQKGTEVGDAIGKKRLDFTKPELAQYGEYCKNDVDLTYKLMQKMLPKFPVFELKLIDLTLRMFSEPVLELDKKVLSDHLEAVKREKEELMDKVAHEVTTLRSNPQFARLLESYGVAPPKKISPTTEKETYAFSKTDEEFKKLLEHENKDVQALVAARLGVRSTIEETRTERFISIAERGSLPIPLRYYAAHTGRWGGSDKINMQNLPRGSVLKKAMCAPKGYQFIDYDLSQIEARTLAWLAGQDDLVEAFDKGDDVYKIMASAIYDKDPEDINKGERFVGKTTILGAGYGMGHNKFQSQLKNFGVEMELEECDRVIRVYRETYPLIRKLWYSAAKALECLLKGRSATLGRDSILNVVAGEGIELPNGLFVKYPNLRQVSTEERKSELVYDTRRGRAIVPNRIYGGKVIENVCQALARIVIGEHLLAVAKKYKVAMTVHDAIGCVVPDEDVEEAIAYIESCMRERPVWAPDLPLDCEGSYGRSYGDCK